MKKSSKKLSFK